MYLRLLITVLAAMATLSSSAHAAVPGPLSPADAAVFWSSPDDKPPEERQTFKKENQGQHFLYCDELYLDLLEPYLRGIGGGYGGVGTDQGYLMMGWMRAELAWLTDYDPLVVAMHRIYAAFFTEAETPQQFATLWQQAKLGRAALEKQLAGDAKLPSLLKLYNQQRPYTQRRIGYLKWRLGKAKIKGFVNDGEDYAWVRGLVIAKRVRPMLGNLLSDKGLVGVGEASRKLNVPMRAFYVSNAEQYWAYSKQFRANMAALNWDAKSWLVRTLASKPVNRDYRYYLHAPARFLEQLAKPSVRLVTQVVPYVAIDDPSLVPLVVLPAEGGRVVKWADDKDKEVRKKKAEALRQGKDGPTPAGPGGSEGTP